MLSEDLEICLFRLPGSKAAFFVTTTGRKRLLEGLSLYPVVLFSSIFFPFYPLFFPFVLPTSFIFLVLGGSLVCKAGATPPLLHGG